MKMMFSMSYMQGGGAERVVSELANCFVECGHDVSILITKSSGCVYPLHDKVHLIDLSNFNKGFVFRVKEIRRFLKNNSFDIVISFLVHSNLETILAAANLNVPVIISERNNPHVNPKGKIYRIMRKILYPLTDGCVFQTPDAKAYFSKNIQDKSMVIMNPINPELPEPFGEKKEKRVVNVGRLVEQKNQKMFIDAFSEFYKTHSDYIAEIYGDGPLKEELESYIQSMGMEEKIILKGFSSDVIQEIKSAAMFVMSSDYEGMSNALIEAVGMGIPCISTDHPIGGARMTIEDGKSGFLVPVGDSHIMAERMAQIADDEELATSFSHHGLLLREKLSINVIANEWLSYIEQVRAGENK